MNSAASTPINRFTLSRAELEIVRSHPSEMTAWTTENTWDFAYPYRGRFSGRFLVLHRDRPRWNWTEEFYCCIDEGSFQVETIEALANLVKEHLGFDMSPSWIVRPGNG